MILKPRLFRKPRRGHWATKGLVGLWLFNEGSGNKVLDLSGNGNTGTFVNTPTWVSGKFGPAVYLPGSNQYITANPINPSDVSISIWVKKNRNGSFERLVFDNDTGGYYTWGVQYTSVNTFTFEVYSAGGHFFSSTATITDTLWHNWVATYNGSQGANAICNLYLDGVFESSGALTNNSVEIPSGSVSLDIGRIQWDSVYYYGQFYIDNIVIYNRIVSASEIALLYREPFCMFERDPIELWVGSVGAGEPPAVSVSVMYHHYQMAGGGG